MNADGTATRHSPPRPVRAAYPPRRRGGLVVLLRDIVRFWPPLAILGGSALVVDVILNRGPEPLRSVLATYLAYLSR